ncbi:large terminase subunit [Citrobacter freundii]|nr:large terminase subunit [Citrobacter freundii]
MLTRYNVQHIGIDGTGIGEAVYQLVKKHFPAAVCYQFSPSSKRMLVLKMQQLIRGGRWEFDRGELDLVGAIQLSPQDRYPGGVVTYDNGPLSRRQSWRSRMGDDA